MCRGSGFVPLEDKIPHTFCALCIGTPLTPTSSCEDTKIWLDKALRLATLEPTPSAFPVTGHPVQPPKMRHKKTGRYSLNRLASGSVLTYFMLKLSPAEAEKSRRVITSLLYPGFPVYSPFAPTQSRHLRRSFGSLPIVPPEDGTGLAQPNVPRQHTASKYFQNLKERFV